MENTQQNLCVTYKTISFRLSNKTKWDFRRFNKLITHVHTLLMVSILRCEVHPCRHLHYTQTHWDRQAAHDLCNRRMPQSQLSEKLNQIFSILFLFHGNRLRINGCDSDLATNLLGLTPKTFIWNLRNFSLRHFGGKQQHQHQLNSPLTGDSRNALLRKTAGLTFFLGHTLNFITLLRCLPLDLKEMSNYW